jgi:hypothetical protein
MEHLGIWMFLGNKIRENEGKYNIVINRIIYQGHFDLKEKITNIVYYLPKW